MASRAVFSDISEDRASSVGHRYVKAALHTGSAGVVSRIAAGLTPVILARLLGPSDYGIYTLVLALIGVIAGISHLGQNNALQKFLPEYFVKDPARGGAILADTIILVSATLAVICTAYFLLSGWIAETIYHQRSLTSVFHFSALIILFLAMFNLAQSATAGLQDFKAYSKALVLQGGAFLFLGSIGVWLIGLYGALLGLLAASIIAFGYLAIAGAKLARRLYSGSVRPVFSRDILAEIFSFAFPAFLSGILVAPAYWWASTLLARDAGFAQVGLFGVAFAMMQLILVIPSNLCIPGVSFMSETYATSDAGAFSRLVSDNLRLIWAVTLPICVGGALFAPWIVTVAFGGAYRRSVPLVCIMSFVGLMITLGNVTGNAVAGSGRMWHGLWINGFWVAVFISSGMFFIKGFGAIGLAWTFLVSYLLLAIGLGIYSVVLLRIKFLELKFLVFLTLACAVASRFLLGISSPLALCVAAGVIESALLLAEWRLVLSPSERTGLIGLATQALHPKPAKS